jgi:hypothetical protein
MLSPPIHRIRARLHSIEFDETAHRIERTDSVRFLRASNGSVL